MKEDANNQLFEEETHNDDIHWVHTLIIGSGAAGLNAAVQLYRSGINDILILTEGLSKGTSINTGSDKQTYYKLSMSGTESDSPLDMAKSYLLGGAMHGDVALIEASLSSRAFFNLVNLGVSFPHDKYGQYVGYKTDHDPKQRATSVGPYTSREMCRQLIKEIESLGIPVLEGREVIKLVSMGAGEEKRIVGALAVNREKTVDSFAAENIIFAVGGPGGLYETSVYPKVQFGSIGLALMEGAEAQNLPEFQFGLASIKFRWNVSGTYMQVIPKFISRASDGISDEREFLSDFFQSKPEMNGNVFLKGYQWPFDARKAIGGSSIIDILVYIETVEKGRRVFLDFRSNPEGYSLDNLPKEARDYLIRSQAFQDTPIERLHAMNPGAIDLYREHHIDLYQEPLEVAVCAQHNNGGLAGNIWWESTNIKHFFPIGEVNGSHGVNRPGGSALNAGQVGGYRAAEYIKNQYSTTTLNKPSVEKYINKAKKDELDWAKTSKNSSLLYKEVLQDIQSRMTRAGAHIRSKTILEDELSDAKNLVEMITAKGCNPEQMGIHKSFRGRQLAIAHWIYLEAINAMLNNQVGSRGSSIILDQNGIKVHEQLDEKWRIQIENTSFKKKILTTCLTNDYNVLNEWKAVRPLPETDPWFEIVWADYRKGKIYD